MTEVQKSEFRTIYKATPEGSRPSPNTDEPTKPADRLDNRKGESDDTLALMRWGRWRTELT